MVLLIVVALVIWNPWSNKNSQTNSQDNCTIAFSSDVKGFDVCDLNHTTSAYTHYVLDLIHDTLLYKSKNGEVESRLAEIISKEGKNITFKLKDNVTFHNGKNVTTDDVIFTFERGKTKNHNQFQEINSIEKIDNQRFKVELKEENLWWDFKFYRFFRVLSKEAVNANEQEGLKIGTGPYKLVAYESKAKLEFELFDNYHDQQRVQASPKKINFKVTSNDDTSLQEIESGALDGILSFPSAKIKDVRQNLGDKLKIVENNSFSCSYLYLNKQKTTLDMRQAIANSLDIPQFIKDLELPAKHLASYLPEGLIGHNKELVPYKFNFNKAQNKISSFNPEHKKLKIGVSAKTNLLLENKIVEALRHAGFDVDLDKVDFNILLNNTVNPDSPYHMIFLGENHELDYGHKALVDYFLTTNNQTNLCHIDNHDKTSIEDKLIQAQKSSDKQEYIKLIQEVSEYIHKQIYVIPLITSPSYSITTKAITQGFETDNFSNFELTNIRKQHKIK